MNWWQQWKWFYKQNKNLVIIDIRYMDETKLYIKGIKTRMGTFRIRRNWIQRL